MATTVTTDTRTHAGPRLKGFGQGARPNGNGGRRGPDGTGGNGAGGDRAPQPGAQYRVGIWVALAAVMMMFAALTSAYVLRANGRGWISISLPSLLWVSTGLLLASSGTFETARRALRRGAQTNYRRWLGATLLFGCGFLVAQVLAWRQLVAQGIYLASNPHSSFVYLLTGLHALHLCGGLLGLLYLWLRARGAAAGRPHRQRAAVDAVGTYWHFMDGLWVYLFALLFLWR